MSQISGTSSTMASEEEGSGSKQLSNKKRKKKTNRRDTKKKNENKSPDIVFKQPLLIGSNNENTQSQMEIDINNEPSTSAIPTKNNQQQTITSQHTNSTTNAFIKNYSARMNEIKYMEYSNLFYINTESNETDRMEMAAIWSTKFPNSKDVILKTKLGFILKSNNDKAALVKGLDELKNEKKIVRYKETVDQRRTRETKEPQQTYSVVISAVEISIKDEDISQHLNSINIRHRYCKRIIARKNNTPTKFIRIITGEIQSFETLLNNGLFYLNRHYLVYPSHPPDPTPIPCGKCLQFDHTTDNCKSSPKCSKCQGSHKMSQCRTNSAPKCLACGAEDHLAWSLKCPKHPKKPIEGIPNTSIKLLNRKTRDIEELSKKTKRIHAPISMHDDIINTYLRKINKPKNVNRNELLLKLKKRFINQYNVDTTAVFSGNRVYILMFDMDDLDEPSPTEPICNNLNIHVQN